MASKSLDLFAKRQTVSDKIHQTDMKHIEYTDKLQYLKSKLESIDSCIAAIEASATMGKKAREATKQRSDTEEQAPLQEQVQPIPLRAATIGPKWKCKAEKDSCDRHIHPNNHHSNSTLKPVKTTGEAATLTLPYSGVESIEVRLRSIKL